MSHKVDELAETKRRKTEHIDICVGKDVQARFISTGLEDIYPIHRALPEISLEEIDASTKLFGHRLAAPIVIEGMTGGTEKAAKINEALAEAAEGFKIALGVGSQRAALEDPGLAYTFKVARDKAPHALLIGNLGAPQIIGEDGLTNVQRAVKMIDAGAFAIHLNSLQEAMQLEGTTSFKGLSQKIREITSKVQVPIIAKETGAGFASEEAKILGEVGVKGIDIGGAGGTSWAAVESYRARVRLNRSRERLGNVFWDWGIPTAVSTIEVSQNTQLTVIASGGIRTGVDIAKSIALGADAVGLAIPFLKPALEGKLNNTLQTLIDEVKTAMFLMGAKSIKELKRSPLIITGRTAQWLSLRGFKPQKYARRGALSLE
ncbi:MAG: type 2 isopentenyl-diphosphate Delta-isomerase [Candidatus Bathyarchaeota archaeon]